MLAWASGGVKPPREALDLGADSAGYPSAKAANAAAAEAEDLSNNRVFPGGN
jgi:hypothetical protein